MKKGIALLLLLTRLMAACTTSESPVLESAQQEPSALPASEAEALSADELAEIPTAEEEKEAEAEPIPSGPVLTITDGDKESIYSYDQLEALGASQASFRDVAYVGVPLYVLLQDAGFDPQRLKAVKVVAVDGFSANYDSATFMAEDTLVAYARADGELADDEKPFRMVVPEGGGGMNVRLLSRIEVIP